MIIDGRKIASEIEQTLARTLLSFADKPNMAIVVVGKDPVIESFVRIKKRMGERLGVTVTEYIFDSGISEEDLISQILKLAKDTNLTGIIIQLPLPASLNTQHILDAVPAMMDVDVLSSEAVSLFAKGESPVLPPVVSAIQEILERSQVHVANKEVLILGHGRLVGSPAAIFFRHNGAHVTVIDREIRDLASHVRESAIIICGVGKPGLITPDMLSPETVVIDAGTSESGGKIVGDCDPKCADVAGIFTPVPGGVGPIAVAMIFKNLCILSKK